MGSSESAFYPSAEEVSHCEPSLTPVAGGRSPANRPRTALKASRITTSMYLTHLNPLIAPSCLPAAYQQLAFRVCRCADSILSAGTRRRFRTSLSFDSVQMSHLVGSNCHGFTPLR